MLPKKIVVTVAGYLKNCHNRLQSSSPLQHMHSVRKCATVI